MITIAGRYIAEHSVFISDSQSGSRHTVYTVRCRWWRFCTGS